jgi:hypothetical protein
MGGEDRTCLLHHPRGRSLRQVEVLLEGRQPQVARAGGAFTLPGPTDSTGSGTPHPGWGRVALINLPAATPAASAVKNSWAAPNLDTSRVVNSSWPLPICHPRSSAKKSGLESLANPYSPRES